ncbi:MAG: hypothetical protein L3J69_09670 [Desulfobacula sp.]|nr:hypothetical protein [Desulfobacula sp.]
MKRFFFLSFIVSMGMMSILPPAAAFDTLESRYATITFEDIKDLRQFNDELYMGRLNSQVKRSDTIEGEVISKINFIVEKVMVVLDMFPAQLRFKIMIHPDARGVQNDFRQIYKISVDYIAFYSPLQNKVFYAADESILRVVTHEIGHVVAESYFTISPPQKIHEVMAQYAEQHITD